MVAGCNSASAMTAHLKNIRLQVAAAVGLSTTIDSPAFCTRTPTPLPTRQQ